jgi:hypothetical protein
MTDVPRKLLFSHRLSAGGRWYFFDVKEAVDGSRYILVSEARQVDGIWQRRRLLVFEEHLRGFLEGLSAAAAFLASPPTPPGAYSVGEIRTQHPRAYSPWSAEEDDRLLAMHRQGAPLPVLVAEFQRQPSAIRSRLRRLTGGQQPPRQVPAPTLPPGPLPDRLPEAIVSLVRSMPGRLTRTSLARILVGSPAASAQRYSAHPLFGRFARLSRKEVAAEVAGLAAAGGVRQVGKRLHPCEQSPLKDTAQQPAPARGALVFGAPPVARQVCDSALCDEGGDGAMSQDFLAFRRLETVDGTAIPRVHHLRRQQPV